MPVPQFKRLPSDAAAQELAKTVGHRGGKGAVAIGVLTDRIDQLLQMVCELGGGTLINITPPVVTKVEPEPEAETTKPADVTLAVAKVKRGPGRPPKAKS